MSNKALFLDRDGIINIDHGYVNKIEDFDFVDGIFDVCRHAQSLGYQLIVITNQAGIARGYYEITDFEQLTTWMKAEFAIEGINITDVFFCPHHPEQGVNEFVQVCECRKPAPGMIFEAQAKHHIELAESVFIGDKLSDIQAAAAAGIKNKILLSSNYGDNPQIDTHRINEISGAIQFIS
ncbi:MAG: D-glycero-beta-D-manno-heptose 1,7-bisphosphate 7-phosphatase [Thalassotalea sp.]